MAKRIGRPKSTPESFWAKVQKLEPWQCWNWTASTRNGYGHHSVDCVDWYAHRYAYFLGCGGLPSSRTEHVMHTCNNKLCCNPSHLRRGTARENTRDAYRDGLALAGERHPRTKFSAELVEKIRNDPRPQMELQRIYGISQQHISRIKGGHSRKHEGANAKPA
jgi:hypothetical protein